MDRTGLEPVTYRTSLAPITRYPVSTASKAGIEPAQDGTPIALPIELSVRVLKIQYRFSNLPRAVIGGTKVSCVHGQFGRKFIRNCCFSAKLRHAHFLSIIIGNLCLHFVDFFCIIVLPYIEMGDSMNVVSLFSGIGGLDLGFLQAGFDVIWANDFDKYAVQTYRANFDSPIVHGDITQIPLSDIPDFDVLVGGFPCQPFSIMGSELGFDDARGTLFFRIAEIINDKIQSGKKPRAVILENVRRLKTHDGGRTFAVIKKILETDLGYKVHPIVLNSADFGVPQTRNRIFIVCFANSDADFIPPRRVLLTKTQHDLLEPIVSDKYFVSDKMLPTILSNGTGGYRGKSEIDLPIARPLCATMAKMHRACQDNYVTQNGRIRRLTPRECARLQGFSDDFIIPVSDTQAYREFGNAVTVNTACAVAQSVRQTLELLGEWR